MGFFLNQPIDIERHNLLCDQEMGLPAEGWPLGLDFQNSYDQAWFGCPFRFFGPGDVPDTVEILKEDPAALDSWPEPDPFWGRGDFMKRVMAMHEAMVRSCEKGLEFHGRPALTAQAEVENVCTCGCRTWSTSPFRLIACGPTSSWARLPCE